MTSPKGHAFPAILTPPPARQEALVPLIATKQDGSPPSGARSSNGSLQSEVDLSDLDRIGVEAFHALDRTREALIGQWTGGISPAALSIAYFDWSIHLAHAYGKQWELIWKAARKSTRLIGYALACAKGGSPPPCIEPLPSDKRFAADAWREPPFNLFAQSFLLTQQWWHNVTHEVPGVTPHHEEVVSFVARQMLDIFAPSNNPFLNPEVLARARQTGGGNFQKGHQLWLEDVSRKLAGQSPTDLERFAPGVGVATTRGRVVMRNQLIELIQYEPATPDVIAEPIFIVPAWIMKYYILDLSPENSLIRYLVENGHTVFCISWRNPSESDRDLSLDDYRRLGVMAALGAISTIVPDRKVHAVGYCLGGTLLSIAAAAMAQARDTQLASLTLIAAQTDFSEPGELALFIDHSQTHFLESVMWSKGTLSADQMAGAFALLRSNDLIWSRLVRSYLMGERDAVSDLQAWNADTTRMPYRMHAEYLHRLYLDNELASGRFLVVGRSAAIRDISVPLFVVGAERDHVAPWMSVFKIHHLADTDITFVLASGGHNVGIVNPPEAGIGHYRIALQREHDLFRQPEDWVATARLHAGSWWPAWTQWLREQSNETRTPPPTMGAPDRGLPPLDSAPGSYVRQR